MSTADADNSAYHQLGEVLLEEILVQAGIAQGRTSSSEPADVTLNVSASAAPDGHTLVLECERLGQAPLVVRLDLGDVDSREAVTSHRIAPGVR